MNVDFRARKSVRFFCAFLRRVSFHIELHGKICAVLQADFACACMRSLCSFYAVLKNHPKGVNPFPPKLFPSPKPAVNTHFLTTRSWKAGPLVAAAAAGFELQMLALPAALAPLTAVPRPG